MYGCLNKLEESSNFSAGVLQANLVNRLISIALHYCLPVMVNSISLVFLLYHPVSAWKQCSQWFNNPSGIFIQAYLSIQSKKNGSTSGEPVVNVAFYLAFR